MVLTSHTSQQVYETIQLLTETYLNSITSLIESNNFRLVHQRQHLMDNISDLLQFETFENAKEEESSDNSDQESDQTTYFVKNESDTVENVVKNSKQSKSLSNDGYGQEFESYSSDESGSESSQASIDSNQYSEQSEEQFDKYEGDKKIKLEEGAGSKRNRFFSKQQKHQILKYACENSISAAYQKYGVHRNYLYRWLKRIKNQNSCCSIMEQTPSNFLSLRKIRNVEKVLTQWMWEKIELKQAVSQKSIRDKAKSINQNFGFKATWSWAKLYFKRNPQIYDALNATGLLLHNKIMNLMTKKGRKDWQKS